jgi:hypothetical protein
MKPQTKKVFQRLGKALAWLTGSPFFSIGSLGTIASVVVIFWHRVYNTGLTLLQLPMFQWTWKELLIATDISITLSTFFFLSGVYIHTRRIKSQKDKPIFVNRLGVDWKYDRFLKKAEGNPFCPKCRIRLRGTGSKNPNSTKYVCDECNFESDDYNDRYYTAFESAKNLGQAIDEGYYRKT